MSARFIHDGEVIDHTPVSTVDSGSVVVLNDLVGIANFTIPAGRTGGLRVAGVFDLPKKAEALTVGTKAYWDADGDPVGGTAGSGALTATATDNTYVGKITVDAASGDALARTRLEQ